MLVTSTPQASDPRSASPLSPSGACTMYICLVGGGRAGLCGEQLAIWDKVGAGGVKEVCWWVVLKVCPVIIWRGVWEVVPGTGI